MQVEQRLVAKQQESILAAYGSYWLSNAAKWQTGVFSSGRIYYTILLRSPAEQQYTSLIK